MHDRWDDLLDQMTGEMPGADSLRESGPRVSRSMIARVLTRVMLAAGPITRGDLARGEMLLRPSTLAAGTVAKAIDSLLRVRLLREPDEPRRGTPGRPTSPLVLNGSDWMLVGIHVDQSSPETDELTGVLCGLDRVPIDQFGPYSVPRSQDEDLTQLVDGLLEVYGQLTQHLPAPLERSCRDEVVLGVGVELGGQLHEGHVVLATHSGWRDIPLHETLSQKIGVPVVLENDTNALALHYYYSRCFTSLDAALVSVFYKGVGGALILDGRPYRGSRGLAPEPGHLTVEHAGEDHEKCGAEGGFAAPCACSEPDRPRYGHVDALATPKRIEAELGGRSLREATSASRLRGGQLLAPEAQVLSRAGRALGRGLAQLANITNPGQVLLRLPQPLAEAAPQSSGAEYLAAAEGALDEAFSTAASDARSGKRHLEVQGYTNSQAASEGALAAATTVLDRFLEHARGRHGHPLAAPRAQAAMTSKA